MAKRNVNFPDREPNEEDATSKQLDYLRHLADIDESELQKLGKWQASALIDKIKEVKDNNRSSSSKSSSSSGGCLTLIVVMVIGIIAFQGVKSCFGGAVDSTKTANIESSESTQAESTPATSPEVVPDKLMEEITTQGSAEFPVTEISPIEKLKAATLPVNLMATDELVLLDEAGKESTIPKGSIIVVRAITPGGTVSSTISGRLFVGNESRFVGKFEFQE